MRLVCAGDERSVVSPLKAVCQEINDIDDIRVFGDTGSLLDHLKDNAVGLAVLDLDIPGMDGITFASKIRNGYPRISLILIAKDDRYAVDAFSVHAYSYLKKPIDKNRLADEIGYVLEDQRNRMEGVAIGISTEDGLDLRVEGRNVNFARSKAKELFRYLYDRRGSGATRAEIFAALWGSKAYDRSMQKQLDVVIRSLRATLKENGISELLEMKSGSLRIRTEYMLDI